MSSELCAICYEENKRTYKCITCSCHICLGCILCMFSHNRNPNCPQCKRENLLFKDGDDELSLQAFNKLFGDEIYVCPFTNNRYLRSNGPEKFKCTSDRVLPNISYSYPDLALVLEKILKPGVLYSVELLYTKNPGEKKYCFSREAITSLEYIEHKGFTYKKTTEDHISFFVILYENGTANTDITPKYWNFVRFHCEKCKLHGIINNIDEIERHYMKFHPELFIFTYD